jgi:hypothetical protein
VQAHFQAHWRHPKCEVFPDAFRAAHPFDDEIPVEHREQQLHFEQGETAAGANARTRTKRNVRRYVVRAGVFAEPAPGPEGLGLDEVIRIARRRTREHKHSSSLRHEQITDRGLDRIGATGRRRIVSLATAPAQASLFAVSMSPATSDVPRSSSASRRNSITDSVLSHS